MAELLALDEPRMRIAAMMRGLDIRYDLGDEYPLVGCRMPDLDLSTADSGLRLFALLHDARGLLPSLSCRSLPLNIDPWAQRVSMVESRAADHWLLPVIGEIDTRAMVLVRPDGYVSWIGDHAAVGLRDALNQWFA